MARATRNKVFTMRFTDLEFERLERRAEDMGMPLAIIVRRLLEIWTAGELGQPLFREVRDDDDRPEDDQIG